MRSFIFKILMLPLITAFYAAPVWAGHTYLKPADLFQARSSGLQLLLVDVRDTQLFKLKHIDGAINIPYYAVDKKGLPKQTKIIIYDKGLGTEEASAAAARLSNAGYADIAILSGGLAGWEALGLPLYMQMGLLEGSLVDFITVKEFSNAMAQGAALKIFDVRDPALFSAGAVPGSVNLDREALLSASGAWRPETLIMLIDNGDDAALKLCEELRRAGFRAARFLYGGFPEWKRQNSN